MRTTSNIQVMVEKKKRDQQRRNNIGAKKNKKTTEGKMDDETYKKRLYDFIIHVTEHPKSFLKLTSLHLCWLFLINTQVAPSGLKNKIKKIKIKKKKVSGV